MGLSKPCYVSGICEALRCMGQVHGVAQIRVLDVTTLTVVATADFSPETLGSNLVVDASYVAIT